MQPIAQSTRLKVIEQKWRMPIRELFHRWHWDENLKHKEIGERTGLPRVTVTRWFQELGIPSQPCTRFTNLNLWSFRPDERPKAKPKIKKEFPWKVNQSFFQNWSEEMAYVLGFIVADGAVYTNPRGSQYLAFYSTDREIIEKIRIAIGSNHTIGVRLRSKRDRCKKDLYVLQIGSKQIVSELKKFGIIQNKSLVLKFPKGIPDNHIGHFVRGYFDGDGCIYFQQHKTKDRKKPRQIFRSLFTSGSRKFLLELRQRLYTYMNGGCLSEKLRGWQLSYSHNDSRALFHLMYDSMQGDLCLSRKYTHFKKALSWAVRGEAVLGSLSRSKPRVRIPYGPPLH